MPRHREPVSGRASAMRGRMSQPARHNPIPDRGSISPPPTPPMDTYQEPMPGRNGGGRRERPGKLAEVRHGRRERGRSPDNNRQRDDRFDVTDDENDSPRGGGGGGRNRDDGPAPLRSHRNKTQPAQSRIPGPVNEHGRRIPDHIANRRNSLPEVDRDLTRKPKQAPISRYDNPGGGVSPRPRQMPYGRNEYKGKKWHPPDVDGQTGNWVRASPRPDAEIDEYGYNGWSDGYDKQQVSPTVILVQGDVEDKALQDIIKRYDDSGNYIGDQKVYDAKTGKWHDKTEYESIYDQQYPPKNPNERNGAPPDPPQNREPPQYDFNGRRIPPQKQPADNNNGLGPPPPPPGNNNNSRQPPNNNGYPPNNNNNNNNNKNNNYNNHPQNGQPTPHGPPLDDDDKDEPWRKDFKPRNRNNNNNTNNNNNNTRNQRPPGPDQHPNSVPDPSKSSPNRNPYDHRDKPRDPRKIPPGGRRPSPRRDSADQGPPKDRPESPPRRPDSDPSPQAHREVPTINEPRNSKYDNDRHSAPPGKDKKKESRTCQIM